MTSPARVNHSYHSAAFGTGYGTFGDEVDRALRSIGVENPGHIIDPSDAAADRSLESDELAPVALWTSTPPHVRGWYEGQLGAIFTMWESTQMPAGFRENLPDFDRVFVPSLQNLDIFSRLHPDVRYVPLGVNPETWHYRERLPVERDFVFLTSGGGPRKNTAMVASAFQRVFGDHIRGRVRGPVPRLVIQAADAGSGNGILPVRSRLTPQAVVDLYASAHCYVTASRGEGWGLMPNQSIAQGCPTILPDSSGMSAFAHYGIGIPTITKPAGNHTFWGDGGEWWEPDFDALCQAMWAVYSDYDRYLAPTKSNSASCLGEFNWQLTAERLLYNLPEAWEAGPAARAWCSCKQRLFRVLVTGPIQYTINGVVHAYKPGVEYWETADLKMRLGESGKLDAACIDPLELGREVTQAWIEAAATPTCPTCGQVMPR